MQIGRGPTTSDATDVPGAMRAAAGYGQRPAVVVLRPEGRQEQGFATLLQWAAKVAHWLQEERAAEPGDRLVLAAPAGWLPAAAALGAWWSGLVVAPRGPDDRAPVATVAHEDVPAPDGATGTLAAVGDAFDGGPERPGAAGQPLPPLVQLYPDDPPQSRGGPDLPALAGAGRTQRRLCDAARGWDADGPVGLSTAAEAGLWLPAVALRPLVTGHATVVLDRVDRDAASAEQVAAWLGPDGSPGG